MSSFHIESVVREDGSILILPQTLQPGTRVHVVVTTGNVQDSKRKESHKIGDLIKTIDGILKDCDLDSIETARYDYLVEKHK